MSKSQTSLSAVFLKLSNSISISFDLKSERSYNVFHGATKHSLDIHKALNSHFSSINVNCLLPSSETLVHSIV